MVLDLGNQADMAGALGIGVQQLMKRGTNGEGKRPNPEGQHQAGDSQRSPMAWLAGRSPALH